MPRRLAVGLLLLAGCSVSCEKSSADGPRSRPANTGDGPFVARVVGFEGTPQIQIAGADHAATLGFQLMVTDGLQVPTSGLLALELYANGHVVTVDEEQRLAVKDIAMLRAPRASRTVAEQLDALVASKQVRSGDRVIGYKSEKLAAQPRAESAAATAKVAGGAPSPANPSDVSKADLPTQLGRAPGASKPADHVSEEARQGEHHRENSRLKLREAAVACLGSLASQLGPAHLRIRVVDGHVTHAALTPVSPTLECIWSLNGTPVDLKDDTYDIDLGAAE
jgi:hypothetical protein